MGGRRVIRISDAKNSDADNIKDALDAASAGDALLVAATGSQGPRDGLRKLFEAHKKGAAIPCYVDEARDLDNLARQTLSQAGVKISRDAQGLLVTRLGNDRALARRELEKLVLFAGDQEITAEDIQNLIGDAAEFDFDDISYSVFSGEQAALDQGIDRIFAAKGNPVSLLAAVTRHGHRLHLSASKIAAGSDPESALKALRPPVFFKQKPQFQAQLRRWTTAKLAQALQLLLLAEGQCKTTGLPAETICRRVLMRLASAAR
jgi:DNA polymerase-3 subunit delta